MRKKSAKKSFLEPGSNLQIPRIVNTYGWIDTSEKRSQLSFSSIFNEIDPSYKERNTLQPQDKLMLLFPKFRGKGERKISHRRVKSSVARNVKSHEVCPNENSPKDDTSIMGMSLYQSKMSSISVEKDNLNQSKELPRPKISQEERIKRVLVFFLFSIRIKTFLLNSWKYKFFFNDT